MSNRSWKLIYSTDSSCSEEPSPIRNSKPKKSTKKLRSPTSIKKKKSSKSLKKKKSITTSLPGTSSADPTAYSDSSSTVEGLWRKSSSDNLKQNNEEKKQRNVSIVGKKKKISNKPNLDEEIRKIKKNKKKREKNSNSSNLSELSGNTEVKRQLFSDVTYKKQKTKKLKSNSLVLQKIKMNLTPSTLKKLLKK